MEFAENGLWEFLRTAKLNAVCLEGYTDRMRRKERRANKWIPILLLVTALISLSSIWYPLLSPIIAAILTALLAIATVLKDYSPDFFGLQGAGELREADELNAYYERLLIDCETLFNSMHAGDITQQQMMFGYAELRKNEVEKGVRLNAIVREIADQEDTIIKEKTNEYIYRVYGVKPEPNNEKTTDTDLEAR